eukprot:TRINITY_DN66434_c9_g5_i1.p1 TRINITY_DN66434_c9_g5~~TRINITY_DN66434_c9_g5_i1.p1  ORF type:complete len:738 (-),score=268.30 TRINITY_DN66434_c9_g5_i1:676-2832(-)
MNCRKHRCQERCCTLAPKDHRCMQMCNRTLACGKHKCWRTCHSGDCPPCDQWMEQCVQCPCGRTVEPPPVRCGTRITNCPHPCRLQSRCGHALSDHRCHPADEPCLPCMQIVVVACCTHSNPCRVTCDKARNRPETVKCSQVCGRDLGCGHTCVRPCGHSDSCAGFVDTKRGWASSRWTEEETKEEHKQQQQRQLCTRPCKLVRADCSHPCSAKCHWPDQSCEEASGPCAVRVPIRCACGRIQASIPCHDRRALRPAAADDHVDDGDACVLQCDAGCVVQNQAAAWQSFALTNSAHMYSVERLLQQCTVLRPARSVRSLDYHLDTAVNVIAEAETALAAIVLFGAELFAGDDENVTHAAASRSVLKLPHRHSVMRPKVAMDGGKRSVTVARQLLSLSVSCAVREDGTAGDTYECVFELKPRIARLVYMATLQEMLGEVVSAHGGEVLPPYEEESNVRFTVDTHSMVLPPQRFAAHIRMADVGSIKARRRAGSLKLDVSPSAFVRWPRDLTVRLSVADCDVQTADDLDCVSPQVTRRRRAIWQRLASVLQPVEVVYWPLWRTSRPTMVVDLLFRSTSDAAAGLAAVSTADGYFEVVELPLEEEEEEQERGEEVEPQAPQESKQGDDDGWQAVGGGSRAQGRSRAAEDDAGEGDVAAANVFDLLLHADSMALSQKQQQSKKQHEHQNKEQEERDSADAEPKWTTAPRRRRRKRKKKKKNK